MRDLTRRHVLALSQAQWRVRTTNCIARSTMLFVVLTAAAVGASAAEAVPSPCGGTAQIVDASGDGHHPGTDVLDAWFSEDAGQVLAVIQIRSASWRPEHDDSEINTVGYAMLFTAGGVTRYARVTNTALGLPQFDVGSYTASGGFVSSGPTTGTVAEGTGGTATIALPVSVTGAASSVLGDPFVLTYDGINGGTPAWVDQAPGGTTPSDLARGANFVVGSCSGQAPAPGPGEAPGSATTSVTLVAPKRQTGNGTVAVTGRVSPAAAGVAVTIRRRGKATTSSTAVTAADGAYSVRIPIRETTGLRAAVGQITSQEQQVLVRSTVRINVRKLGKGRSRITVNVAPTLPGRLLLLREDAITPSVRLTVSRSTFSFTTNARPGRYQAVYIPSGDRAERSTSNTGVLR